MNKFRVGDRVIFRVPFNSANKHIEVGDEGIVRKQRGPLGFYSIVAKGQIWLARASEIEKPNST